MNLSEVRTNYDRAAKYYDALTDLVFDWILGLEKYREQTIDTLGELRGATVVDVGCGTGRSFSSIPDSGFLRWLYPIYSFALRHAGIDTAEDLDNAKLQAKWERGRDVMRPD
jgi:SAM-dependent methyltransferase